MNNFVCPFRGRFHGQPFTIEVDTTNVVHVEMTAWARDALQESLAPLHTGMGDDLIIARTHAQVLSIIGPWGAEALQGVASSHVGAGLAVLHNLPFEDVEWSPRPGEEPAAAKETAVSEHLLTGFSTFWGDAYGVRNEGRRLVNDLWPSRSDLERHTGNGSRKTLGLHTENAALRFASPGRDLSPKALLLTGVSAQLVGGPTTPVAIAASAVRMLGAETVRVLRSPCTRIALPERWRVLGHDATEVGPVPVVIGADGREEVIAAYYGDMMRPASAEAAAALSELREALQSVAIHQDIRPGMMVAAANGRVLHGRSDFEPVLDDQDRAQRWIQRIFVTGRLDLFRDAASSAGRVFDVSL